MKEFFEVLYYITGGPLLLIAAIIGLKQLKISRQTAANNCRRDALRIANEQCSVYLNDVVDSINILDKLLSDSGFDLNGDKLGAIENKIFKIKLINITEDHFKALRSSTREIANCLNRLESFSSYIISGIADDETAFRVVGTSFCYTVKRYAFLIGGLGDKGKRYVNIVELYNHWSEMKTGADIDRKIQELQQQLSSKNVIPIKPVGL